MLLLDLKNEKVCNTEIFFLLFTSVGAWLGVVQVEVFNYLLV